MLRRGWAIGAMLVLPACSLYFGNGHDGGSASEVDAPRTLDAAILPDAAVDSAVACAVVVSYDWNDGTTQGWTSTTAVSNASGALHFTNALNGSLQTFGPTWSLALAETDVISFSVEIDNYSTVTSPAQLTYSAFNLESHNPGDGSLRYALDLSGLAFGQPRVYTFPVSTGVFTGTLSRAAFLTDVNFASLIFADSAFDSNYASGTLDNFSIVRTNCP